MLKCEDLKLFFLKYANNYIFGFEMLVKNNINKFDYTYFSLFIQNCDGLFFGLTENEMDVPTLTVTESEKLITTVIVN